MSDVQLTTAHAMTQSYDRTRHLIAEVIDHVKEVAWMVVPRCFDGRACKLCTI